MCYDRKHFVTGDILRLSFETGDVLRQGMFCDRIHFVTRDVCERECLI